MKRNDQLIRADMMLKYFKQAEAGYYNIAPAQVELIKTWWWELHNYCEGYEFSFNDNYTKIKKYENNDTTTEKGKRISW